MVSESDNTKKKESVEKPKAEKPKAEEPKAEKPKAEEPKVEEPKAEEPTNVKIINILNHIQDFQPGDTVSVNFKIIEGERQRIQSFEGSIISGRKNKKKIPKIGQNFIIRRVSYGIGVERIVPFFSPNIESVNVIRRGKVRRSKLYYLRGLTGKKARIKEKI